MVNGPPEHGSKWKMNLYRIDYDEGKMSTWSWQLTNVNFHDYKSFGALVFK